jgi:pyrophosphatase PpaX
MKIKGILFDLDGTLGNTMPICVTALQDTFSHFVGKNYTSPEIYAMFGPSEEGAIGRIVPEPVYPAAVQYYLDRYADLHQATRRPFDGVYELLAQIKEHGMHSGVVTGKGRGSADISIREMGLAPYIDLLITGSPVGAEKPAAIRQALEIWGLPPAEAAYVGDMSYDMQAAREAGVLALGAAWAESATVGQGDGAAKIFTSVPALARWLFDRPG